MAMKNRYLIGLLYSLMLIPLAGVPVFGEESVSSGLVSTPSDTGAADDTLLLYLRLAAKNNPGLEAAFDRWQASLQRADQVTALPEPKFTYAYYIEEVETRVGPQEHRFSLMQGFPGPGKLRLRGEVADQAAQTRYYEYEAARRALFHRVKTAYYEYYYLGRALAVTRDNIEILAHLEEAVRGRYTVGEAAYANVVKVQVELGKLSDRLQALEDMRQPLAAQLNAALNRPLETEVAFPAALVDYTLAADDAAITALVREHNPALAALHSSVETARRRQELAARQRYPDFALGLNYIATGEALMPNAPGSGDDPIMGSITLSIPLWGDKYDAAEAEAEALAAAASAAATEKENALLAQVQMTLYRYRDAERRLRLFENTLIPKAEQSFAAAQTAFSAGTIDFVNLLDAERLLLEFTLSRERALTDSALYLAELEMLVGSAAEWEDEETRDEGTRDEGREN